MQHKQLTGIFILATAATLIVGTFVLLAAGVLRPSLSLSLPRTAPSAVPAEVQIELSVTPTPTEKPTVSPVPSAVVYPPNAVNLLVNGSPLFALSGKDAAEQMLSDYLSVCASENLTGEESLIRAYIDAELSLLPVDGTVDYLSYEEAKNRLLSNRALIPVVRSTQHALIEIGSVETTTVSQPLLPSGARLYRSLGKAERRFSLTETLYKNGIAVSDSTTLASTRIGSDPAARVIENGTFSYRSDAASETEGPKGKDAGDLKLTAPCRGTVISWFGKRGGTMHYGIDYSLRPGESIVAPESGTVIFCGIRGDYGLVIEIQHGNGFVSRLTHCASPTVELDQHVYRGDRVALLAAEDTDEPHLHYELLIDGIPFNPLPYLQ